MDAFKVLEPGAYTTVQDRGRFGFQQFGVPPTGMLDGYAGTVANILAGNDEDAAVLEFTFMGGAFEALASFDMAVAGAHMPVTVNGETVSRWSSTPVTPGDIVRIGQAERGCRAYLALTGGIDVPLVMGSRSCYTGGCIGGQEGRPLKRGDIVRVLEKAPHGEARKVPEEFVSRYPSEIVLRAVAGPQDEYFDTGLTTFFGSEFTVTPQANRMGYRLDGPAVLQKPSMPGSIISEPSLPGGVQIPGDGKPIILLVEQTVGGYTKVATVVSTDIPRVAQAVPGDRIRFTAVSLDEAHALARKQHERLEQLRQADLAHKTFASMGEAFFSDDLFREKIAKHLIQI